jgi:hypothetical protein
LFSMAAKEENGSRRRKRGRDAWHALRIAFNDTSLVVVFLLFIIFLFSSIFPIFSCYIIVLLIILTLIIWIC